MNHAPQEHLRRILSGQQKGLAASTLRVLLSIAEPFYATAVRLRKKGSDPFSHPVLSVGNITTGGTGKTPVVAWLANALRAAGQRPAVLMRGYKSQPRQPGDEQRLLESLLNHDTQTTIPIQANPNRRSGALTVLSNHPHTTLFILDDGFQHIRLPRLFDLVLIDAANPFGYGHVLPRGLLREPLCALARAHAFLMTRADQANTATLDHIEQTLRHHNPTAPIYRADHAHSSILTPSGAQPFTSLASQPVALFTGIGNPRAFAEQLAPHFNIVTQTFFADHHPYTRADLDQLIATARQHDAAVLLTTEKDYVKLAPLLRPDDPPIWRPQLTIRFHDDHESRLLQQIQQALK